MGPATFHRLADRELSDTTLYYQLESAGLGIAFLGEVERCLRSISTHPDAAPILSGSIRRRILRRFPYALLYAVKRDGIRILAVMNLKRRPAYRVGRVSQQESGPHAGDRGPAILEKLTTALARGA